MTFVVNDSGARQQLAGGMVRDVETAKVDYTLVFDGPMLKRWAEHLTKGAIKYAARNWMLALAEKECGARLEVKERYKRSAIRHMIQWMNGDRDEDHAAAVLFNLNGYEAMLETDPL